ncbi:Mur ligase family protein, partial [Bacillus sp. SIMBA_005]|uniref:Mur ligase family protein n=1 Tax=Bacillus sp. SIMBA_005 TaxID=3085754 RepID=UPI00397B1EFF
SETADVRASDVVVSSDGTDSVIEIDGARLPLHLRVLGAHHVKNALAALTAATALGVDPAAAIERLETIELAERWRM